MNTPWLEFCSKLAWWVLYEMPCLKGFDVFLMFYTCYRVFIHVLEVFIMFYEGFNRIWKVVFGWKSDTCLEKISWKSPCRGATLRVAARRGWNPRVWIRIVGIRLNLQKNRWKSETWQNPILKSGFMKIRLEIRL